MGTLKLFNLNNYIDKNNVKTFIETGTAQGHGLEYANSFSFNKLYSIEYSEILYNECVNKFNKFEKIKLFHNKSNEGLIDIFENYEIDSNIIFWLDAHYPGADLVGTPDNFNYGDDEFRLPLENELKIIKKYRKNNNDIIIIDDLRIYEDNSYESGIIPNWINPPKNRNIDFVNELFSETHNIIRNLKNEGYLILEPK
jgi:hypothetical protein